MARFPFAAPTMAAPAWVACERLLRADLPDAKRCFAGRASCAERGPPPPAGALPSGTAAGLAPRAMHPGHSPERTHVRRHLLERAQHVPRPRSEVFAFFSDAHNLEAITPGSCASASPRPARSDGPRTAIDYRLSLFGVPFGWRSLIGGVRARERFVDVQVRGPYRTWRHLHEFADAPGGTLVRDRVEYELPLGPLGEAARALFVRRALERIFDHRARVIAALLAPGLPSTAARGRSRRAGEPSRRSALALRLGRAAAFSTGQVARRTTRSATEPTARA